MRSDLVFDALQTKNRFALCHEAFRAIRLLHKSKNRIEDTANNALQLLAGVQRYQCSGNPESADEAVKDTQKQVAIESPAEASPVLPCNLSLRANS